MPLFLIQAVKRQLLFFKTETVPKKPQQKFCVNLFFPDKNTIQILKRQIFGDLLKSSVKSMKINPIKTYLILQNLTSAKYLL